MSAASVIGSKSESFFRAFGQIQLGELKEWPSSGQVELVRSEKSALQCEDKIAVVRNITENPDSGFLDRKTATEKFSPRNAAFKAPRSESLATQSVLAIFIAFKSKFRPIERSRTESPSDSHRVS